MTEPSTQNRVFSQRPADAPRATGATARRRSWGEWRVRPWWMLGGAIALLGVYVMISQLVASVRDRQLVRNGTRVEAKIIAVDGNPLEDKFYGPELNAVFKMVMTLPGRPPITIEDRLKGQRKPLGPGMSIPLAVDPSDPADHWTDRLDSSWWKDLMAGYLLLPPAIVLLAISAIQRKRVLRAWCTGEAMEATVVDSRYSPLAPLSRTVRFTVQQGRGQRIYSTLVPLRLGVLNKGDVFWVVTPPENPARAVVAAAYQE